MFSNLAVARKYYERFKGVDVAVFAKLLWGDYYFDKVERKFGRVPGQGAKRTFVEFVLEPIYKIFSHTVGKDRGSLEHFLAKNLDIYLTPQ